MQRLVGDRQQHCSGDGSAAHADRIAMVRGDRGQHAGEAVSSPEGRAFPVVHRPRRFFAYDGLNFRCRARGKAVRSGGNSEKSRPVGFGDGSSSVIRVVKAAEKTRVLLLWSWLVICS